MDFIVVFFRDILDGPLYIIVALISGILFCSCIGYLAEQNNLKKAAKEKFNNSYATVANIDNSVSNSVSTTSSKATPTLNQPVVPPNTNTNVGGAVNNGQGSSNIPS